MKNFLRKWLGITRGEDVCYQVSNSRREDAISLKKEVNALTERVFKLEQATPYIKAIIEYLDVYPEYVTELDPQFLPPEPRTIRRLILNSHGNKKKVSNPLNTKT